jgi:phosphate/sulfate permease
LFFYSAVMPAWAALDLSSLCRMRALLGAFTGSGGVLPAIRHGLHSHRILTVQINAGPIVLTTTVSRW